MIGRPAVMPLTLVMMLMIASVALDRMQRRHIGGVGAMPRLRRAQQCGAGADHRRRARQDEHHGKGGETRHSDDHSACRRSRSALPMTETELNVIAALAMIGLSSRPKAGYRTPAATGTPSVL